MKFVEIYKIQNNGSQRVIAKCKLVDEIAICEGDKVFVENLENEGVWDYSKKLFPKIFPKDGINFLEALRFNFKSGYLNASEIKEE